MKRIEVNIAANLIFAGMSGAAGLGVVEIKAMKDADLFLRFRSGPGHFDLPAMP